MVRPDTTGLQLEHRQAPVGPSAQAFDRTPDDDDASLRVHVIATHRKRHLEQTVPAKERGHIGLCERPDVEGGRLRRHMTMVVPRTLLAGHQLDSSSRRVGRGRNHPRGFSIPLQHPVNQPPDDRVSARRPTGRGHTCRHRRDDLRHLDARGAAGQPPP